jgi:sialate O-acetylesterase
MRNKYWVFIVFIILFSCKKEKTEIYLPALFSNHMVLQQKVEAPIWGRGTPGSDIQISTSWNELKTVTVNEKGNWFVKIATPQAGGPYTITLQSGKAIKKIDDVYIGEVWLASGQSNMEMPVKGWGKDMPIDNSAHEIASSENPKIRMFTVKKEMSFIPKKDCVGDWKVAKPENTGDFSATAYFFAKNLYKKLKVPIGIIHSSWGGTPAEAWTSKKFVANIEGFENTEKQIDKAKAGQEKMEVWLKDIKGMSFNDGIESEFKDEKNDGQYITSSFNDVGWKEMDLPAYWETRQLKSFDGIVWFRKKFNIPEGTNLKNLKLYLGKIDDMDDTFINGKKVGGILKTGFWDKERLYPIDEQVLHYGMNTISVKVIDNYGGGGIYGDKNIGILNSKNDTLINLSGKWKFLPVSLIKNGNIYHFNENSSFSNMPESDIMLNPHFPTVLYNGMIAPLIPFTIKGVIWYQGESNVGRAKQYETLFPAMINNWRSDWSNGNFPFYYVQIAPFNYNNGSPLSAAELRNAQFLAMKEKNVGMVVTTDIGDINNIHPSNKSDVGKRLALWALKNDYGIDSIISSGPLCKNAKFDKTKVIISFSGTGKGLKSNGKKLNSFEIAGKDSVFYDASAVIEDHRVIVSCRKVKEPRFVRFGWKNDSEPNLFNSAGLPAFPFIEIRK